MATNRYRDATTRPMDHGKAYESHVSKRLGARLTPASGAMVGAKGDMSMQDFLIESKTTTDSSLALKLGWLVKISEEAQCKGKKPAVITSFVLPSGRPQPMASTEWVCLPLSVFQELLEK